MLGDLESEEAGGIGPLVLYVVSRLLLQSSIIDCDEKHTCMSTFTASNCAGDGSCFCKDGPSIDNANSCIGSSSCSDSDKEGM